MGPGVRPAALLALSIALVVVHLATRLEAARTRAPAWTESYGGLGRSDNDTSAMTPPARVRTRRIAVHDLTLDDDEDDALLMALHRARTALGRGKGVRPPMHKVSLTQIGYIQFLRYMVDVPEMRELSFCVWLRSRNLTHNHPIFSYSKNERQRLVRAWVSPAKGPRQPPRVHLSVMERPVFVEPLPEAAHGRWLHICQSWDGRTGQYRLYVDGRLRRAGVRHEVAGLELPGGGDIVVGQEYTDFDKGLDDGVEGDIFGFYLFHTAAPSGETPLPLPESEHDFDEDLQRHQLLRTRRRHTVSEDGVVSPRRRPSTADATSSTQSRRRSAGDVVEDYAGTPARRKRQHKPRPRPGWRYSLYKPARDLTRPVPQRVQRLYALCTNHLTPEERAEAVVDWPRTPVRVFGGAILSNVNEGCGDF